MDPRRCPILTCDGLCPSRNRINRRRPVARISPRRKYEEVLCLKSRLSCFSVFGTLHGLGGLLRQIALASMIQRRPSPALSAQGSTVPSPAALPVFGFAPGAHRWRSQSFTLTYTFRRYDPGSKPYRQPAARCHIPPLSKRKSPARVHRHPEQPFSRIGSRVVHVWPVV